MPLVETDAIILRSYDLNDADRIAVAITRDHGVVRGVAKGAKRLKSKFGSGLEPFSIVRLHYSRKEAVELASISRSDLLKSNFSLAGDIEFLEAFGYVSDLIITFSPPDDPNELLFRLVSSCLDAASKGREKYLIAMYFEAWTLKLSGLLPDLGTCGVCGRQLEAQENVTLKNGHDVLCSACDPARTGREVLSDTRDVFFLIRRSSPATFADDVAGRPRSVSNASQLLSILIDRSAGREIRPKWLKSATVLVN